MPLLPQSTADLVAQDGLPRQVLADDSSLHVLYLDAGAVRSMHSSAWPPPLPSDPTPAQVAAAIAARATQAQQDAADAAALRVRVRALAQSTVGVQIDALTAPQVRALIVMLLWKGGAIDKTGAVRPLVEWE